MDQAIRKVLGVKYRADRSSVAAVMAGTDTHTDTQTDAPRLVYRTRVFSPQAIDFGEQSIAYSRQRNNETHARFQTFQCFTVEACNYEACIEACKWWSVFSPQSIAYSRQRNNETHARFQTFQCFTVEACNYEACIEACKWCSI